MGRSQSSSTKRSSPIDLEADRQGRRRRHRHPYRQRAARLRDRPAGARARRLGRVRRHSRHALPRRSARARRRARGRQGRRRRGLAKVRRPTASPARRSRSTTADAIDGDQFLPARWDLLPQDSYMWASVQTVRGCPKHCSFCSVWRTDGQEPRQREVDRGRRRKSSSCAGSASASSRSPTTISIPVSLEDLAMARRRADKTRLQRARGAPRRALRADGAARAAARRHRVLHADHDGSGRGHRVPRRDAPRPHPRRAGRRRIGHARGAEGRLQGLQPLRRRARRAPASSSASTASTCSARSSSGCRATRRTRSTRRVALAEKADLTFAQFVLLTPFPGTLDFEKWAKDVKNADTKVDGIADHPALADSGAAPPEALYRASDDVARRDPRRHAGRVGRLLQLAADLVARLQVGQVDQGRGSRSC